MHSTDVHVWLIEARRCGPALRREEARTPRLSVDEIEQARTYPDPQAARRWLEARTALRMLLEAATGRELRGRPFVKGVAGKPCLDRPERGVSFNVSHSGENTLIAISLAAVGVDLEEARRTRFSHRQRTLLISAGQALAGEDQVPVAEAGVDVDGALLRAWVRLESVAKARASGIGSLLNDIGMRGPSKVDTPSAVADRAAMLMAREGLKLEDLSLPAGLWGAVAVSAPSARVWLREFPADVERIPMIAPSSTHPPVAG